MRSPLNSPARPSASPHADPRCATTCACARWRVGLGLIPPRTMHSPEDAARAAGRRASGARRVVEIGVYEGASALALLDALGAERGAASDRPLRPARRRAAGRVGRQRVGDAARARRARCAGVAPSARACAGMSPAPHEVAAALVGRGGRCVHRRRPLRGRMRARLVGLAPASWRSAGASCSTTRARAGRAAAGCPGPRRSS